MILQEIMKGTVLNLTANLTIDLNSAPKVLHQQVICKQLMTEQAVDDEFNIQLNQNQINSKKS